LHILVKHFWITAYTYLWIFYMVQFEVYRLSDNVEIVDYRSQRVIDQVSTTPNIYLPPESLTQPESWQFHHYLHILSCSELGVFLRYNLWAYYLDICVLRNWELLVLSIWPLRPFYGLIQWYCPRSHSAGHALYTRANSSSCSALSKNVLAKAVKLLTQIVKLYIQF